MGSDLEKICNPVFQCVCNYWQLSRIGGAVDKEKFRRDITELLQEAERMASRDSGLGREFAWVEKPLVFFIDYMVKEGRFPFKEDWWELSRNYNELSGDEKFFDLLDETLERPDFANSFALFYVMLGLGFDGAYRHDRGHIERCMRLCAEKAALAGAAGIDVYSEPVSPPFRKKSLFRRRRRFNVRTAVIASACFMVVGFIVNLMVFANITGDFRGTLRRAVDAAVPRTHIQAGGGR